MAGAIAHHFNNQLQVVMGNLELLSTEVRENSTASKRLSDALKATAKAAELSSLMLSYLGQSKSRNETLNLADACRLHFPMLNALESKTQINRWRAWKKTPILRLIRPSCNS
jgi:hypothetical protein